ncbi:MAG: amidase, partial [Gammaproteobacteria bacterium]|nr:amidase [Gammaproteobacteria bacterium]
RERAREQAARADAALARGEPLGPLHGLPMTVKESFDVAGLPTTHGIAEQADNIAREDALAVQRLKRAGAVIFGKTNVPLRLADFQSYNDIYGTTNNPYDLERVPGGSSGGSAATLAAGLCALECGSDIGGSIRNPAHFCGVFGHKPTWGLLPPRGHALAGILAPTDISVIGPLARSAADLERALLVMAGPNEIDARGYRLALDRSHKPIDQLKVAVWNDDPIAPVSREVRERVDAVASVLANAGAEVDHQARPAFSAEQARDLFQALLQPAMSGRLPDADFDVLVERRNALADDDHGPGATLLRNQTARHRDWLRSNEQRTHMRWAWHRFFQSYDVLLTPVMAVPAFRHDQRPFKQRKVEVDGRHRPYFEQVFWAGLTGASLLPSTVVPTGASSEGTPIGVQIAGAEFADLDTIALAGWLELEAGFRFVPPGGYEV